MKMIPVLAAITGLIAAATPAPEGSGVVGSKHDFTAGGAGPGDACAACHVPHLKAVRAVTDAAGKPALRMEPAAGQREVFRTDRYTPGPASLVCLGCHDGTVATSAIGSAHAIRAGLREGFGTARDYPLRDHPVGVRYPDDPRKFRPAVVVVGEGSVRLPDGRVECVSCHDPHNRSGTTKMLVRSNKRSRLCLSCHIK
jgi:predicted CXXCH cytochrome family protein